MTSGQMAPTSLDGMVTTTSPCGEMQNCWTLKMGELISPSVHFMLQGRRIITPQCVRQGRLL
jgi:hypothetical protein